MKLKNYLFIAFLIFVMTVGSLVFFAFARTWGKTEIEFKIHINEKVVQQSTFGESPTFAIWLEDTENHRPQTVFVTKRAALGDWEGKPHVPVALPKWFEIYRIETQSNDLPTLEKPVPMIITGATPKPGYFITRVRVTTNTKWNCYIEVNLAGDFNEYYKEYNEAEKTIDKYLTGQPALLYKTKIITREGVKVTPEIIGMSTLESGNCNIRPLIGITTAKNIFDKISITVIKPKPKIIP